MEFKANSIVELRNGILGIVVSFNGKPSHLVFKSYTNPITQYNENLQKKNSEYDVMKMYDGSTLENITDIWKNGFNVENYELIWERNND